jgi:hypothetical protein
VFIAQKHSLSLVSLGLEDTASYTAKNMKDSNAKHLSSEYITECEVGFTNLLAQTQEFKMESVPNEGLYRTSGKLLWI